MHPLESQLTYPVGRASVQWRRFYAENLSVGDGYITVLEAMARVRVASGNLMKGRSAALPCDLQPDRLGHKAF